MPIGLNVARERLLLTPEAPGLLAHEVKLEAAPILLEDAKRIVETVTARLGR